MAKGDVYICVKCDKPVEDAVNEVRPKGQKNKMHMCMKCLVKWAEKRKKFLAKVDKL